MHRDNFTFTFVYYYRYCLYRVGMLPYKALGRGNSLHGRKAEWRHELYLFI